MPFVVTSCAFKIHKASGPGRGKPVLAIGLLTWFLRHNFRLKKLSQCSAEPVGVAFWPSLLRVVAENIVIDRYTDNGGVATHVYPK